MSNRRRLTPPDVAVRYAKAYRCADCISAIGKFYRDPGGVWHVEIKHDDSCPVLTGTTDPFGDVLAAARELGGVAIVGRPV